MIISSINTYMIKAFCWDAFSAANIKTKSTLE